MSQSNSAARCAIFSQATGIQTTKYVSKIGAIGLLVAFAEFAISPRAAANSFLSPGLYQVEVRISLPNVRDAAAPLVVTRCVSPDDLKTGKAFSVLSDNPLRKCELLDYKITDGAATYRIVCPGPNKGSAVAMFQTTGKTYGGSIKMNMGGKNMTMSETQAGKLIGDCPSRGKFVN